MAWSAQQYTIFENQRTRPVRDLLAGVPGHEVRNAVDIGCGPGNSTEVLATWYPDATVSGFDPDADMIAAARKRLPGLNFEISGVESWDAAGPFDVLLSNAVFQWVPDHAAILPKLVNRLAPGGSLGLQIPDNRDEPTHLLMEELARDPRWSDRLGKVKRIAREKADWYYRLLKPLCTRVDLWRTDYIHPLPGGAKDVTEWFKGSSLRPFLEPLTPAEQRDFLAQYTAGIEKTHTVQPDGAVLMVMPRLFIVATR